MGRETQDNMAKIDNGILGGFSGHVGPVIGYEWRGRMCMRSMPRRVRNPRTEAQTAHRDDFRRMVQLAATMRVAVRTGLHTVSVEEHMTEYNLFVKLNFGLLGADGIDYSRLRVSAGDVAPVGITAAAVDDGNVARIAFVRNPLHQRADADDRVYLYAFCPEAGEGLLSAPVLRRDRRLAMQLPDGWAGREVHLYCFVQDWRQHCSETIYVVLGETVETTIEPALTQEAPVATADGAGEEAAAAAAAPQSGAETLQLSLFDGFI